MQLDHDDEQILAGEQGETKQKMLELLVALGKVFGAERLVPIKSAQVSGASYKTIGKYGLQWLNSLDAKAVVPAVLNPIGMPRTRWQEMGVDPDFAKNQQAVVAAYARLGIALECTCTPYYLRETSYGDHLAWSESSAVSYANSVIGARTNREGGPGALAAALIGKTPCYGLHLAENRKPQVVIVCRPIPGTGRSPTTGRSGTMPGNWWATGSRSSPASARNATSSRHSGLRWRQPVLLHCIMWKVLRRKRRRSRSISAVLRRSRWNRDEIAALFREIPVDAVALGCPHCSPEELGTLARLLAGKRVTKPLYVFASQGVIDANRKSVETIEKSGAKVYADTCMVVSPVMEQYTGIMVNSGKALAYVPDMCGGVARIGTTEECVQVATE